MSTEHIGNPLSPKAAAPRSIRAAMATLLGVGVLLGLAARDVSGQANTPYGRAVKLLEAGKASEADLEVARTRSLKRSVEINATVFVASDKLVSDLSEDVRRYIFPSSTEAGAVRVNARPTDGGAPAGSFQVTPRSDEQVALLSDTIRRSPEGALASLFGMKVSEMQVAEISFSPDRGFPSIGQDGKPEMDMVREGGQIVKKVKLVTRAIPISIRPVASDNGAEMWLRFFDDSRPFDPYPPTSLTQPVAWRFPGKRDVALGPPEYEQPAAATGTVGYVKTPASRQLMISGIMAIGGERVRQGLPLLDLIPVVGETVFSSQATVHYKIWVCIVFDVGLAR